MLNQGSGNNVATIWIEYKDPQTNKLVERLRTLVPISTFLSDNWEGVEGNASGSGGGTTTPPDDGPDNQPTDGD